MKVITPITQDMLQRISSVIWEIPCSVREDMQVPARVYATENMLRDIIKDRSLTQLINVATLPGIVGAALAMPDIHEGYGFPIGGVAAMEYPDGVISPGGIGYDINCGVRLLRSSLSLEHIKNHLGNLTKKLYRWIPSGVGTSGRLVLTMEELNQVLLHGAGWMVTQGYAYGEDLMHLESNGYLGDGNPDFVSEEAKMRGHDQLGTLGSGNHFAEVGYVDEVFDQETAQAFGLAKGQVTVLIHTGSRGLGHQVATDHIKVMGRVMESTYGITLPDRELACVPFSSPEGKNYFSAMSCAANFAWANRQLITWEVRQAWQEVFGKTEELSIVYDVAHNIAKIETHLINNKEKKVIVHRKGATRAFGPGHPEIAEEYRAYGQPVLIPGSMGTASYVLAGTTQGMHVAFGSSCHGAGRVMSRKAAKAAINGKQLRSELLERGIYVEAGSIAGLAEEAPQAYKDIDEVINVVHDAGIAKKVVRLRPVAVIKG